MGHFKKICEYGKSHGQCRCMGPHEVIRVPCDRPEQHAPKPVNVPFPMVWDEPSIDPEAPEPLAERLDNVLERELWWMTYAARQELLAHIKAEINK